MFFEQTRTLTESEQVQLQEEIERYQNYMMKRNKHLKDKREGNDDGSEGSELIEEL